AGVSGAAGKRGDATAHHPHSHSAATEAPHDRERGAGVAVEDDRDRVRSALAQRRPPRPSARNTSNTPSTPQGNTAAEKPAMPRELPSARFLRRSARASGQPGGGASSVTTASV